MINDSRHGRRTLIFLTLQQVLGAVVFVVAVVRRSFPYFHRHTIDRTPRKIEFGGNE
jgi:hypothetical protein